MLHCTFRRVEQAAWIFNSRAFLKRLTHNWPLLILNFQNDILFPQCLAVYIGEKKRSPLFLKLQNFTSGENCPEPQVSQFYILRYRFTKAYEHAYDFG